jgi:hypothetical protein
MDLKCLDNKYIRREGTENEGEREIENEERDKMKERKNIRNEEIKRLHENKLYRAGM